MLGTGYFEKRRAIAKSVIERLQLPESERVQTIIGPSGSGKTHLAQICQYHWTVPIGQGQSVWLRGDSVHSLDEYYPFEIGLDEILERIRSQGRRIPFYSASYNALGTGFVGGLVKQTIEGIVTEGSRLNVPMGTFRYIAGLKRIAKGMPLLLILDDIQAWDAASLRFLKVLLSDQAIREFPFLGTSRFLLIFKGNLTAFQNWTNNIANNALPVIELSYPSSEEIPEVMAKFGFDSTLTPSLLTQISSITGGHLSLVKNLALLLTEKSGNSPLEIEQLLRSRQGLLSEAISKRLQNIPGGDLIKRLLTAASVIGESFDERELDCVSRDAVVGQEIIQEPITRAIEFGLLHKAHNRYAFEHDIIRTYFLDCSPEETVRLNEKFSDCLRMLRPAAYLQRAKHLKLAGKVDLAVLMESLDALRRAEEGEPVLESKLLQLCSELDRTGSEGLSESLKLLLSVIDALSVGNSHEAYSRIRRVTTLHQPALEGWRLYLSVRCAIKTRSHGDIYAALQESQSRNEFVQREFDIWMRVKGTEIIGLVYLGDQLSAMREYHRLMEELSNRFKFDPFATFHAAVLQRRSPSVFDAQRSVPECEKAVAFFNPENPEDLPLYPRQLFMSRTNLSGSLISSGRFQDAMSESAKAIQLRDLIPGIHIQGIELAFSNNLIAGVLSRAISPEIAKEQYVQILHAFTADHDRYLLDHNMAVLCAICGNLDAACSLFRKLLQTIQLDGADDPYYLYWALSNAAWACFENHLKEEALLHWRLASQHQDCVHPADRRFLKARHHVLEQFLVSNQLPSRQDLNDAFAKAGARLDTPWLFWGRAYLPSDVHFWSSS